MAEAARSATIGAAGVEAAPSVLGRRRAERRRWRLIASSTPARGLIGGLILIAVAEAFTRSAVVDPQQLPYASTVIERMLELLGNGAFMVEVWATIQAWMLALGVAILVGVPLGILFGLSSVTYRATSAVVEVMRPVPGVALIPLAVLVWGQGTEMKVILVAYATVWPILFNSIYGVHGVDPVTIETARAFGLPRRAILRRVVLPSAAPFILTGIRISASIGLIVLIGTELVTGATSGIGTYILNVSLGGQNTDAVFAAAAIAGLLGVLINGLFSVLERRAFAWSARGERS